MTTIICHNQKEFDKAIKEKDALIVLQDTTERIIIKVKARENSSVEAWENSSVEARENSSVVARGNSSVVAWGNSSVVARGNSSVVARENSSVVAWGNSSVVARENSNASVMDNSHVLVIGELNNREFKQYDNGTIKKHIEIKYDKTVLDRFEKENGKQVLYKAVNPETNFSYYNGGIHYKIGEEIIADDFDPNPDRECGGGLHLCFSPKTTKLFTSGRTKILKCLADPVDIAVYSKNIEKVRCRAVIPVAVVDMHGKVIEEESC